MEKSSIPSEQPQDTHDGSLEPGVPHALFVVNTLKPDADPGKAYLYADRGRLVEEVRNLGVEVAFTRGQESFDVESEIINNLTTPEYSPDFETVKIHHLGSAAFDAFTMMRVTLSRLDGVEEHIPSLNPQFIRDVALHKSRTIDELLRPVGAFDRAAATTTGDPTVLDQLPGDTIVLKPDTGRLSKGLIIADKSTIAQEISAHPEETFVIEEYLDLSSPLPSIRGDSPISQQQLEQLPPTSQRELRTFYYGNDTWDGVMRIDADKTASDLDQWITIDLDSIPEEIMSKNHAITQRLADLSGQNEFFCAIDWVYAPSYANPAPHWQVMEVGSGAMQVYHHENIAVAARQRKKLASLIARMAQRNSANL